MLTRAQASLFTAMTLLATEAAQADMVELVANFAAPMAVGGDGRNYSGSAT